jgi:hypothetical protein
MNEGELLPAEAGGRKIGGVFDAEGINVFEGGYEAGDFLFHVICFPMILFCFPNNWKINGDYPPVGGKRNPYFDGTTVGHDIPNCSSGRKSALISSEIPNNEPTYDGCYFFHAGQAFT